MSNRLYLLNQAKYIQETYGKDTVPCLFAKEYLHSLQGINCPAAREHSPKEPSCSQFDISKLALVEEVKSFAWKFD